MKQSAESCKVYANSHVSFDISVRQFVLQFTIAISDFFLVGGLNKKVLLMYFVACLYVITIFFYYNIVVSQIFLDLVQKTWLTYRCSPLHQFKCDSDSLKQYSRLISATFVANKQKKMGVGLDEDDPPSKGIFSLAEGLAVQPGNCF